jgi:hypothetical protein
MVILNYDLNLNSIIFLRVLKTQNNIIFTESFKLKNSLPVSIKQALNIEIIQMFTPTGIKKFDTELRDLLENKMLHNIISLFYSFSESHLLNYFIPTGRAIYYESVTNNIVTENIMYKELIISCSFYNSTLYFNGNNILSLLPMNLSDPLVSLGGSSIIFDIVIFHYFIAKKYGLMFFKHKYHSSLIVKTNCPYSFKIGPNKYINSVKKYVLIDFSDVIMNRNSPFAKYSGLSPEIIENKFKETLVEANSYYDMKTDQYYLISVMGYFEMLSSRVPQAAEFIELVRNNASLEKIIEKIVSVTDKAPKIISERIYPKYTLEYNLESVMKNLKMEISTN